MTEQHYGQKSESVSSYTERLAAAEAEIIAAHRSIAHLTERLDYQAGEIKQLFIGKAPNEWDMQLESKIAELQAVRSTIIEAIIKGALAPLEVRIDALSRLYDEAQIDVKLLTERLDNLNQQQDIRNEAIDERLADSQLAMEAIQSLEERLSDAIKKGELEAAAIQILFNQFDRRIAALNNENLALQTRTTALERIVRDLQAAVEDYRRIG